MYWKFLKEAVLGLFVLVLLGGVLPNPTQAQTANDKVGITVTPITDEFRINPGEVIARTIRVINPGDEVITLYPRTLNFFTDNEDGQPVFFSEQDESSNFTLSSWVTFEKEFIRIAKNEEEQVRVIISAPEDAEPGGHYGAILFSTEKPTTGSSGQTEIGVVGLVGTLFLASVPGDVLERLDLEQYTLPRISFSSPVEISQTYRNTGNVHAKPVGDIVIKNWSGNQVGIVPVNEGKGNILPQSRRKFSQSWEFDPLRTFGVYTFSLQSTYGSTPVELNYTKKVLIVPYWVIAIVIAGVLYAGYRLVRKRRMILPNNTPPPEKPKPLLR